MMPDVAVTPELPGVRQAPFQQQLWLFSLAVLSPSRDNRMSRYRMNTAVVRIDNQQGYSRKAQRIFLPQVTYDVIKIVPKVVAEFIKLRHTCTKLSHNYDESSYVFEGSPPPG